MTQSDDLHTTSRRRWLRAGAWVSGLALLGLVALGFGISMIGPSAVLAAPGWWGGGGHHGGHFGHGRRWGDGPRDPEHVREHIGFVSDHILDRVDANDEQREQVKALLADAAGDLLELRANHESHREAIGSALSAPEVDRAALEQIRGEALAMAEAASSRLLDAVADVAEVLTPEQRTELLELAERFHH